MKSLYGFERMVFMKFSVKEAFIKIIASGLILSILSACVYIITINNEWIEKKVDFQLFSKEKDSETTELKIKKTSKDFNKNYKAVLYFTVSFFVNDELITCVFDHCQTTLTDSNTEQAFIFDISNTLLEQYFSNMTSITYYIDKKMDQLPKISVYLNVIYTTKVFEHSKSIWYIIDKSEINRYYDTNHDLQKAIDDYQLHGFYEPITIYLEHNKKMDIKYINNNITVCMSYDELVSYIDSLNDRKFTKSEKIEIKNLFKKNSLFLKI